MATVLRRRLAPSRLQPITARTSSSIRPLSFFDALAYAPAYFLVIVLAGDVAVDVLGGGAGLQRDEVAHAGRVQHGAREIGRAHV